MLFLKAYPAATPSANPKSDSISVVIPGTVESVTSESLSVASPKLPRTYGPSAPDAMEEVGSIMAQTAVIKNVFSSFSPFKYWMLSSVY